jgi:hypothetical protein
MNDADTIITAHRRFWDKVDTTGDCWAWTASLSSDGYGRYRPTHGALVYAHRFAWEMLVAPIATGSELDHLCRNPACVNPDHLEPVTKAENQRRGYSRIARQRHRTTCTHGHPLTGDNVRIRPDGGRLCRNCKREESRRRVERRKPA